VAMGRPGGAPKAPRGPQGLGRAQAATGAWRPLAGVPDRGQPCTRGPAVPPGASCLNGRRQGAPGTSAQATRGCPAASGGVPSHAAGGGPTRAQGATGNRSSGTVGFAAGASCTTTSCTCGGGGVPGPAGGACGAGGCEAQLRGPVRAHLQHDPGQQLVKQGPLALRGGTGHQ
jgi:hypothetical protein